MARRELISGRNFSGRSAAMMALLRDKAAPASFYIGPYSEAALSGLTSSIADEIDIYGAKDRGKPGAAKLRPPFAQLDFPALARREPQTLSGGEQVLLALYCFSLSDYGTLAIDTALEQLDRANRAAALDYLDPRNGLVDTAMLIDNRLPPLRPGWRATERAADSAAFPCDPRPPIAALARHEAPGIDIRALHFRYRRGPEIFRAVDLSLHAGAAYRLSGPNGAGKTTLLKLLVGVLAPTGGEILLGGERYRPWRTGNRAIALATQNPDHQWCGATLHDDIKRRRAAFARRLPSERLSDARVATIAAALGVASLDAHLYELPLAARKRLSWWWPLSGALPWVMFDEPSLGQDLDTRLRLAEAIGDLTAIGYGVLFVTHDDDFADRIPHRALAIGEMQVKAV